jgi:hypothetical protein
MMFNDKPKIDIPRPGITIGGGRIEPDLIRNPDTGKRVPGIRFTKKFAAGGQTGYRKVADGCAKRGKTRGKMV